MVKLKREREREREWRTSIEFMWGCHLRDCVDQQEIPLTSEILVSVLITHPWDSQELIKEKSHS